MGVDARSSYPLFHPRSARPDQLSLTADEFAREFPRETSFVEFKSGVGARPVQEAVVAFSNSSGGVLLIGVEDDGRVVGRELTQSVEESIHQAVADARNVGQYSVQRLLVDDRPVVVVSVAPRVEGFAQTSNGRILTRMGPRNSPLFDADLLRFISERALERFELRSSGVDRSEVESKLLDELIEAFDWSASDAWTRLQEKSLITADGQLTIAGALFLLPDPAARIGKAFVEVLRFPAAGIDYDKRTEIRGPIHHQVREATAVVLDELGTELVVLGVQRHELRRLPPVVLREAIANAVAHRSYEASRTAVRVEIRPDEVVVVSPGPLPIPVTEENIRDAQAPRNLAVIRALRQFGVAEDAGRGVDVMQDEMRAELLDPPRFRDTGHSVEVTLPVRSPVTARERAWIREIERRGEMAPADRIVLVHAARGEPLTNRRVRELTGLDRVDARRALQRLKAAGFLRQFGTRGGATYVLDGSLNPPAGLRLPPDEIRLALLELAREGPLTNATVRERFGLRRSEALRLLDDLVRDGALVRRGERRGAHYLAA